MSMPHFYSKTPTIIYVFKKKHVKIVEEIIKSLDPVEYEAYYPDGVVQYYKEVYPVCSSKFDLDIKEFLTKCAKKQIPVHIHQDI